MKHWLTTDRRIEANRKIEEKICPVCKKSFIPAAYHVFHLYGNMNLVPVCSWSCQLASERKLCEKRENAKMKGENHNAKT